MIFLKGHLIIALIILTCCHIIVAPPAPTKTTLPPVSETEMTPDQDLGLHYDEYLQAVIKLLESDDDFRASMEQADFEDILAGNLSDEVKRIPGEIREKLDALKREELNRLRRIQRVKIDLEKGIKPRHSEYLDNIAEHLDSSNPHTFEAEDLTNLIKAATTDLENYDEKRHQEFKQYEMMKDMRRLDKLEHMSSEEKKKVEEEYQRMREKHINHPKVNHPGSKAQLDEVWREKDGLVDEQFDPKTFFMMHDVNGDKALDPVELEALFDQELAKVYDIKNPEDDMVERDEEQRRMREHVTKEVDKDGDGLVSLEEFLAYTKTEGFEHPDDESYKSVDELIEENDIYSPEELEEFRKMVQAHEKDLHEKLEKIQKKSASIAEMKEKAAEHEKTIGTNPAKHEISELESKKKQISNEEKALEDMKQDAAEHREELTDMNDILKEQDAAIKSGEKAGKINAEHVETPDKPEPLNFDSDDPVIQMEKTSD